MRVAVLPVSTYERKPCTSMIFRRRSLAKNDTWIKVKGVLYAWRQVGLSAREQTGLMALGPA